MLALDAIAYIDGFNLYYGSLKGTGYKWLDLQALVCAIAPRDCTLQKIRYFTAKVKPGFKSPSAHTDQGAYLQALQAHCPLVETKFGHFLRHQVWAENAKPPPATVSILKNEEKGSDVNLAVHLLNDAWSGAARIAILVSNDSDLSEAVELARQRGVRVYWFPPTHNTGRVPSAELRRVVGQQRGIYPKVFSRCLLPNPVVSSDGEIRKPSAW